jgi:hypothetical protein
MSWPDRILKEAEKRLAQEPDLLKHTYSADYARYAKETNLFFSFGDVTHFINTSLNYSIQRRKNGNAAGIACFEDLIKRLRLYLIAELKFVLANKEPFNHPNGPDYNFVTDFLDLFETLDRLEAELKEIREKEGGFYQ